MMEDDYDTKKFRDENIIGICYNDHIYLFDEWEFPKNSEYSYDGNKIICSDCTDYNYFLSLYNKWHNSYHCRRTIKERDDFFPYVDVTIDGELKEFVM
jgi:hypothetical protein